MVKQTWPRAIVQLTRVATLAVALVTLFVAPSLGSGCILFVDDDYTKLGNVCHIQGAATACGKCITDTCQGQVNACCNDTGCRPVLDWVDQCAASSDFTSCYLISGSTSTSTTNTGDVLRACITNNCPVCSPNATPPTSDAGANPTPNQTNCFSSGAGDSCSCNTNAPLNSERCSAATVTNGVCCADIGWPGRNLSCTCRSFLCQQQANGCECSIGEPSANLTSCTPPSGSGWNCCVDSYFCRCGPSPCFSIATQVPSCTKDQLGCGSSNKLTVSTCSQ